MSRFIENMKTKPYHHQRAFALAVSGSVTIMIFTVWAFVHFGQTKAVAANPEDKNNLAAVVTPFQDLKSGIESSYNAFKSGIDKAKGSIQSADLNGGQ